MKKYLAVALVCALALVLVAASASAAGYKYVWKTVNFGASTTDTTSGFYIPSGASIAIKNSKLIDLPANTYWMSPADSLPQFIVVGTISAAGASTDTLCLGFQWTYDGSNYIPALDWDTDDQCHVGAGLYFTYRLLSATGAVVADQAAGAGRYAAGVPNTYGWNIMPRGARGMRLVVHPSHAARTNNGKLSVMVGIPVTNDF